MRLGEIIRGSKTALVTGASTGIGRCYAEQLAEKDGDAYTYTVECEYGIDIRKNIFFLLHPFLTFFTELVKLWWN